ncbi:MAG: hypothetical protein IPG04_29310 [Polyangiaceae bacterium]|jgi:hypothetical protein|nr:hypothetical protein [Polyangiaceae bacterium]
MRASRIAASWVGVGALSAALACVLTGCTVDVEIGFQCEDESGELRDAGETYELGCTVCSCNDDGTISCDSSGCFCLVDQLEVPVGTAFGAPDGCNTCSCTEAGEVACTAIDCACSAEPPPCDLPHDGACWYESLCDDTFSWQCVLKCECDDQPWPECGELPPGCTWAGPVCANGAWDCGELICEEPCSIEPPLCEQPPDPSCWAEPVCWGQGWECVISCSCGDPLPECPPDTTAECTDQGWFCVPYNLTCGAVDVVCDPQPGMDCAEYPTCNVDGTWSCVESCDPAACFDPEPQCTQPVEPQCLSFGVCSSMGAWDCIDYCQ